ARRATIPRRSDHWGSAACPGRSGGGSRSSTCGTSRIGARERITDDSSRSRPPANRLKRLTNLPDGHLVNSGVQVVLTTHSDTLLQQLNILMHLHGHPRREE